MIKIDEIIELSLPDFEVLTHINKNISNDLRNVIKSIISVKEINNDQRDFFIKVLSIIQSEIFIKALLSFFYRVSHDSKYAVVCILRILIERFSIEYLRQIPDKLFNKLYIKINYENIRESVSKDIYEFKYIFNNGINETKQLVIKKLNNMSSDGDPSFNSFKISLPVIFYSLIENLSRSTSNNNEIYNDYKFNKIISVAKKYYLTHLASYCIDIVHGNPKNSTITNILEKSLKQKNPYNFVKTIYEKFHYNFTFNDIDFLNDTLLYYIFHKILVYIITLNDINIPNFDNDLKILIDKNINSKIENWIYSSAFKKELEYFFEKRFKKDVNLILNGFDKINLNLFNENQLKNIITYEFCNNFFNTSTKKNRPIIPLKFKNVFKKTGFGSFAYNYIFSSKKKFRVFFILTGLEFSKEKLKVNDITIYNENWYFFETATIEKIYAIRNGPIDKFKFKVLCDVESNNPFDALIIAQQKCNLVVSSIVTAFQFINKQDSNFVSKPDLYYLYHANLIITFPSLFQTRITAKWPVQLNENNLNLFLKLFHNSNNDNIIKNSLLWFKESYYSEQSYSKFVFYWTVLESIISNMKQFSAFHMLAVLLSMNLYKENNLYMARIFSELGFCPLTDSCYHDFIITIKNYSNMINDKEIFNKLTNLSFENNSFTEMFNRLFILSYIYKRRNNIIHEGESFSFENIVLTNILSNHTKELIVFVNKYKQSRL